MKKVLSLFVAVMIVAVGFANSIANDALDENREQKVHFYYQQGLKADNEDKSKASIGDALRYYYWSLILCCSYPQGSDIMITNPETGNDCNAKEWLYKRINSLLGKIEFAPKKKPVVKNKDGVVYEFIVTDGHDRIPWLCFEYDNGQEMVESWVESGMASVELVNKSVNNFEIHICVENKKEAEANARDVYDVMTQLGVPLSFAAATKNVDVKRIKDVEEAIEYQDSTILTKMIEVDKFIGDKSLNNEDEYLRAMKSVEKAVRNRDIDEAKYYFSKDGFEMFKSLLSNGRYYILGTPEYKFMEFKNMVICRSIPMQFNFKGNVGFIRHVVFRFDKNTQKIVSIAFRLTDVAEIDILGKDQWNADSRMILVNFLEDYQTAYALKRQDYLNKIFSDDALIIVGTVLRQKQKGDNMHLSTETMVRYDTLSKGKYMEKLRGVFTRNEFVNIRFLDTDFSQHKSGMELYGIQIKQEYLSSTYGDVGYLFLMVDLREELPIIHVRTWEPEKTETPICFDDIVVEMM